MRKRLTLLALLAGVGLLAAGHDFKAGAQTAPSAAQRLSLWPTRPPARLDPAMESRITAIMAGMTLEQKIGQMTQAEIRSITPDQVRQIISVHHEQMDRFGYIPEDYRDAVPSSSVATA